MKFDFFSFEFKNPEFLLLFILFLPIIIKDFRKKQKGIPNSNVKNFIINNNLSFILKFLSISKYFILSALIIAISRPRKYEISRNQVN